MVEGAYQAAQSGGVGDISHHRQFERIQQDYGRVQSWRIVAQHRSPPWGRPFDWWFDVKVVRDRAITRELVEADAGPSKVYGYYSAITDVRVDSAHPNKH
jgi:hypothetical protein